jgi:NADPH:quinone reductase-like Zn-dependent oxidoreductase
VKLEGLISMVGSISSFASPESDAKAPTFLDAVYSCCTVRAVAVGSRLQFEEMNRAIEANDIHPLLDDRVFVLDQAREAYQYLWDQKHIGKVVLRITH